MTTRINNLARRATAGLALLLFGWSVAPIAALAESTAEDESFEREVRPLLVKRCGECHQQGSRSKSGLQLVSRETLMKGGRRGPAVVAGKPDESLLIEAVRRTGPLKMPPDSILASDEVEMLVEWVRRGATWPAAPPAADAETAPEGEQSFWGLEPLGDATPPQVQHSDWPQTEIDTFLLTEMERAGIEPAPPADKLTLLRRVTFDLTGLPPTREECAAFLADTDADAYAKVVDRLLASPAYGERWARHWLDVIRFAETNGFEDDSEKPNAFRFRDYVVRALNEDLPYDQFVREQIAGDLLSEPRMSTDGALAESPIGSGFWWFGEILPLPFCPIEARGVQANELESQIDAYGKAFLGMTLACARCHDHKFDPIVSQDYYAVGGTLLSTTNVQASLESPARYRQIEEHCALVETCERQIDAIWRRPANQERLAEARRRVAAELAVSLLAAYRELVGQPAAATESVSATQVQYWKDRLSQAIGRQDPLFYPFARLLTAPPDVFARRAQLLTAKLHRMNEAQPLAASPLADFEGDSFGEWHTVGHAFGSRPALVNEAGPAGVVGQGFASSGRAGMALTGRLTSPRFRVPSERPYLCFSIAGGDQRGKTCVNLVLHSQASPEQADLYSATGARSAALSLRSFNLQYYIGQDVCIDVVDNDTGEWGYVAVDQFFLAEQPLPLGYALTNPLVIERLTGAVSIEEAAQRYQQLVLEALDHGDLPAAERTDPYWLAIHSWATGPDSPLLSAADALAVLPARDRAELENLHNQRMTLEQTFPESVVALVSQDRSPAKNAQIHMGGDATILGDEVPRGWPYCFAGTAAPATPVGSGRLELAQWTASRDNPLPARVLVNRLWQHHFGRGIVGTVDNFGKLGAPPTHPALLDYLARQLWVGDGSLKALHRLMLTSAAYQQGSRAQEESLERDPQNLLVHHFPIRRLEAECIRDAMLAVAGRLDRRMFGPSIKLEVKHKHMLDPVETPGYDETECRRSLYIEARRNHAPTLFEAFDFPKRATSIGERPQSSVPEQALVMLNSDFVAAQCQAWADSLLSQAASDEQRIESMYWTALGRPPLAAEATAAARFRHEQLADLRTGLPDEQAEQLSWAALCHVLFNVSEFIFVR